MAECPGKRTINRDTRSNCNSTLYRCKKCGNVGCDQGQTGKCSNQGFCGNQCSKCGATGQRETFKSN